MKKLNKDELLVSITLRVKKCIRDNLEKKAEKEKTTISKLGANALEAFYGCENEIDTEFNDFP